MLALPSIPLLMCRTMETLGCVMLAQATGTGKGHCVMPLHRSYFRMVPGASGLFVSRTKPTSCCVHRQVRDGTKLNHMILVEVSQVVDIKSFRVQWVHLPSCLLLNTRLGPMNSLRTWGLQLAVLGLLPTSGWMMCTQGLHLM